MSDIAIRVEGLSKRYRLLTQGNSQKTWKSVITAPFKNIADAASLTSGSGNDEDYFWALKDINFEVKKGEVVGVIGANGAGKTTLLKILSKITAPFGGRAEIFGRVNSLLAVGTGFNPELTGRENIYMNGTIHGMSKREIDKKLDEIIDFSGVEKFIDMPIKRYSSGMGVRLGFAVAAFLEPEILIVDEVLAVGDVGFQNKCMGKMEELGEGGRTVLVVSHNMQTIKQLSDRGILMKEGTIQVDSTIESAVNGYMTGLETRSVGSIITEGMHSIFPQKLEVFDVEFINSQQEVCDTLLMDEEFCINMKFRIHDDSQSYRIAILIKDDTGNAVAGSRSNRDIKHLLGKNGQEYSMKIKTNNIFLYGKYTMDVVVKTFVGESVDHIKGIAFTVSDVSVIKDRNYIDPGVIYFPAEWSLED